MRFRRKEKRGKSERKKRIFPLSFQWREPTETSTSFSNPIVFIISSQLQEKANPERQTVIGREKKNDIVSVDDELAESVEVRTGLSSPQPPLHLHALARSQARPCHLLLLVDNFLSTLDISCCCCPRKILITCSISSTQSSFHGFAAVNLKVVFLPLLAFEIIILIDNFRMCRALMPGDDESMNDEAIWETLPWSNPVIHRNSRTREATSSSTTIRYLDWNSGLVVSAEEDQHRDRMCGLQDIGGHLMKIPVIGFQVLLCMRLEGTPANARHIPLPVLFSPLFLLQGAGVLFSACRLVEKIVLLLRSGAGTGIYFRISSRAHDCFGFLHHGSRLLGWWSIDEGSREEHARLFHEGASGYNTFCGYPPEIVKKMPKKDLTEEVWRLQAALGEQTEITKYSQQEYERLQNEKVLCRVCFEGEISVVLLPCRHRVLCSTCCDKCKKCPICRVGIEERLPVYDV
ncbi:Transmembrane Fragile-X-F-associated protein [Prunus dulcis]|uniref:Transmembrane Fragile-X-F-associated protein n=1 Tax=Prunus dulcis TaxID=3755 RepID=A0A4Y1RJ29_PRUDU|nr:Transmembrane Fragile-X-F-associated protein [Prunus dulcis]